MKTNEDFILTKELLLKNKACHEGQLYFEKAYPNGINIQKATNADLEDIPNGFLVWLAGNIIQVTREYISRGLDVNAIDTLTNSALIYSCMKGDKAIAKLLLDAGADVNYSTDSGDTALKLIFKHEKLDLLNLLLDAGADVNSQDCIGNTSLHDACDCAFDTKCIKILLDAGANPNIKNKAGKLPDLKQIEVRL